MSTFNSSDELWRAFRQGDARAFQAIYRLHAHELLSYGRRVTNDSTLIEDSIHDLFVDLWQSRANLSDTDSIKFYLVRSLRNKIIRNRSRDPFFQSSDVDALLSSVDDDGVETRLIRDEESQQLHNQLQNSFDQLTPRQQEAINLRFFQHFSNEEIAQIMGINYQSACRFIYSALKTLRQAIRIFSLTLVWVSLDQLL